MRKKIVIIIGIILVIMLAIGGMYAIDRNRMKNNKSVIFSTWGYKYVPIEDLDESKINDAISDYIASQNEEKPQKHQYQKCFVAIKNYLIQEESNEIIVYSWVLYENYYKQDGKIQQGGGSSASAPYKFRLTKNENVYEVIQHQMPRDGAYYAEDIKEIFPEEVVKAVSSRSSDGTMEELNANIEKQVNYYFNKDYNSFIGTVLEETTTYMIVEPNEDEEERKSSDKIRINYGEDHIDYLYGIGRKVLISYTGYIMETYPAQINTNIISIYGYSDFEILVEKSDNIQKTRVLNNKDLYIDNSDYNLYYYGLSSVNVKVDNQTLSLEEALKRGKITLEGIIAKSNRILNKDMYKDGGSMIYKYGSYTIITFNTLDGNRDMYIGIPEMTISDIS